MIYIVCYRFGRVWMRVRVGVRVMAVPLPPLCGGPVICFVVVLTKKYSYETKAKKMSQKMPKKMSKKMSEKMPMAIDAADTQSKSAQSSRPSIFSWT